MVMFLREVPTLDLTKDIQEEFKLSLPENISQVVFPSPSYPSLQEQSYDPTVFVQKARLERQS